MSVLIFPRRSFASSTLLESRILVDESSEGVASREQIPTFERLHRFIKLRHGRIWRRRSGWRALLCYQLPLRADEQIPRKIGCRAKNGRGEQQDEQGLGKESSHGELIEQMN
jgi:hypothetical protein